MTLQFGARVSVAMFVLIGFSFAVLLFPGVSASLAAKAFRTAIVLWAFLYVVYNGPRQSAFFTRFAICSAVVGIVDPYASSLSYELPYDVFELIHGDRTGKNIADRSFRLIMKDLFQIYHAIALSGILISLERLRAKPA